MTARSGTGPGSRRVAIVGAGIAGLACGRALSSLGQNVIVFDRGRGPGGRLSSRRTQTLGPSGPAEREIQGPGGPSAREVLEFDHGAQFASAKGVAFRDQLAAWADDGLVAPWSPTHRQAVGARSERQRWVGTPSMSAIARALAHGLSIEQATRIRELRRIDHAWQLSCDSGQTHGPFAYVAIAVPAPQALELVAPIQQLVPVVSAARLAPCWALMAAWDRPVAPCWDIAEESGPLAWVCKNSSKPARGPAETQGPSGPSERETWVVHADPEWSASYLEADPQDVASVVSTALAELLGTGRPGFSVAHRWRYARVERPVGEPCVYVSSLGIGLCGDWLLGSRVECAYDSGVALARQIASAARGERFSGSRS